MITTNEDRLSKDEIERMLREAKGMCVAAKESYADYTLVSS